MATGILYVRPRGSNSQYQKVWIKSIDVKVNIQYQVAETHIDQVFFNELNQSSEAIYIYPLPENAMVTELVYWLNGERFVAEIRERQEALNDYNTKLKELLDPVLLEYLGNNLFRLSIVPVNALSEFRTEITYIELLNYNFCISKYKFLMNTLELSSKPLEAVHLNIDAKSQNPYKYFKSPSHTNSQTTQIIEHSDNYYTLEFGDEKFFPDKDLLIEFETIREDVEFSFLSYKSAPADSFGTDSFFALWITPPDSFTQEQLIPKDIVFTADVSSSMDGLRLTQVKQSSNYFLDELTENDYFNIITFATHVVQFKEDMVPAGTANISEAHNFVNEMYALGMTNISAALVRIKKYHISYRRETDVWHNASGLNPEPCKAQQQ
jgi:Ca-activated chloride channel family protein